MLIDGINLAPLGEARALFFIYFQTVCQAIQTLGMGGLNSEARLLALEHPAINIVAIVLITIGWSRHKKQTTDAGKFKSIALFYTLGLLLILSRIPWNSWFNG